MANKCGIPKNGTQLKTFSTKHIKWAMVTKMAVLNQVLQFISQFEAKNIFDHLRRILIPLLDSCEIKTGR